jgi:tetratricopeptide (TPR) repeat protein
MPATYNGIGTHYYGKKNLESRPGVCPFCGRGVELLSYDTRLWFVVLFLPVIPLGRKRIIDYCPSCRRHYVVAADKWETAKQLEISGALEKFRSNPTPEAAIEAHQQLLTFHQSAQAAEFRQMMGEKFADNAKLQSYLGDALAHLGRLDEATPFYSRAHALRPDLPAARVGLARGHIRANRHDEARQLLDFMEKPGAAQLYSLEPLEVLANAYQQAGRHAEALELFGKLLEAVPAVGQHKAFRVKVKKSEKALGRRDSVLPKLKFGWRRFFGLERPAAAASVGPKLTWRTLAGLGVILLVVLIGMMIGNESVRRHRRLYIVSGFKEPPTVEVRGIGTVKVSRGVSELVLPEGRHHATITGPVRQEIDFEVRSGYFDRWFDSPAWVLNVSGAAVLELDQIVYGAPSHPGSVSFYFGEPFRFFPKITHPFRPTPESLRLHSGEERVLSHLDVFRGEVSDLFYHLQREGRLADALLLAEVRLPLQPEDERLLLAYVAAASQQTQRDRLEQFLRAGLTNRPVAIQWHRVYQNLRPSRQRAESLAADYDAMLEAEPDSSALLYLRGRLCANHAEGRRWFERAREADPRNPYPYYALAYDRMAVGDWGGARGLMTHAVELRPADDGFVQAVTLIRMALGEFTSLEEEQRARLVRNPLDFLATARLCESLAAQKRGGQAEVLIGAFERAATARNRASAGEAVNALRRQLLYANGDFAALEKSAAGDRSPNASNYLFWALVEQGRLAEAVKIHPLSDPGEDNPFHFLTVAIAWRLGGNEDEAGRWRARALKLLEIGEADWKRAAVLLGRVADPTQAELDDIVLPVNSKAILLMALAQRHPAMRTELFAASRHFNVSRSFPYHLLRRAGEDAR